MSPQETIRTARLARNMSQASLAAAAELSERTIKRAESGHPISPETAQALASVLELPPGALGRDEDASRPRMIVETTMSPEALALDDRREALAAILATGAGTHVIVPDPALLRSTTTWLAEAEARSRRYERIMYLGLGISLLSLALIPTVPMSLFWILLVGLHLGIGSMLIGFVIGSWKSSGLTEARRRFRFAEHSLVVVDGDTLHVLDTADGATTRSSYGIGLNSAWTMAREGPLALHSLAREHGPVLVMAGIPARSALDRFACVAPGDGSRTHSSGVQVPA